MNEDMDKFGLKPESPKMLHGASRRYGHLLLQAGHPTNAVVKEGTARMDYIANNTRKEPNDDSVQ